MLTYRYTAVDKTGHPARGRLAAANEVDLELRLQRMGLDLITLRRVDRSPLQFARSGISRQDLIAFCFHMEQIGRAGIPLLEGLADLRDSLDKPRFRDIAAALLESMEGGKTLSQAMAAHPEVFDKLFVSLIKAGEQSGRLIEVFESLGATLKWQNELAMQTRRLLIYPSLVLAVVVGVVFFLMMYLVPQLVAFLRNMGQALPPQTRLLIFFSDSFRHYWPALLGLPLIGALVAAAARRSAWARYWMDYLKLHLPLVGPILKKIILARFANFFALMYQSGIAILDAMKTSEEIVANRAVADGLARAGQQISAGVGLAESFRNVGIFPPLVVRMLKVGETSGALDSALQNVAYFYNREVRDSVENLLKLLEPALTVVLGLILALIMFAVLTPIYDIFGKLKI
jgi:type IV pilus assembly protein PilC